MWHDSPLVAFHRGEASDSAGRRIDEILAWDDGRLERTHDYIQWLFPTRVHSRFNPDAPVLNARDIEAFRDDERLRESLLRGLRRMLAFYGLDCVRCGNGPEVRANAAFAARSREWLHRGNHNHLRITRILECLHTLGLEQHAGAFFEFLHSLYERYPDCVADVTYDYWRRAAGK